MEGSTTVPAHPATRFSAGMAGTDTGDLEELAAQLRGHVHGEVCFDSGTRARYATGASNYRRVPLGVVLPAVRGAVPASDPRSTATLRAVRAELTRDGYVHRFRHEQRSLYEAEGLSCSAASSRH